MKKGNTTGLNFRVNRPQPFRNGGEDVTVIYLGVCPVCGVRMYGFEGETYPDWRGPLGRNSAGFIDPEERGYYGPRFRACADCLNDGERFKKVEALALQSWRPLVKGPVTDHYISIHGRRWFERVNGNTYHSVTVRVDGRVIGRVDYTYGYGDQYIQTGFRFLEECGLYPPAGYVNGFPSNYSKFLEDRREHPEHFEITVADVARKKDL